nr:MAG TPA: hypothetical protein [Caudoviricetes sp.]
MLLQIALYKYIVIFIYFIQLSLYIFVQYVVLYLYNVSVIITLSKEQRTNNPDEKPGERRKNMIKFLDLFNTMHCDFFEIQKGRKSELVEWEMSGKMLQTCKNILMIE